MMQTGTTEQERAAFIREVDNLSINTLIHRWEAPQEGIEVF